MTKQQNQFVGWALLSMLILGYFHYFSPAPQENESQNTKTPPQALVNSAISQLKNKLHAPSAPQGNDILLENNVMKVTLSTQGGHVKQVALKNYKNYDGSPLIVVNEANRIGMSLTTQEGTIHTQACVFEALKEQNDKLSLIYRLPGKQERYIKHTFSLDQDSYRLDCHVEVKGINLSTLPKDHPVLIWYQEMRRLEKDPILSRKETTLYYYQADRNKVTYLSANNTKEQEQKLETPTGWVSANQKFFSSGVASATPFKETVLISNPAQDDNEDLIKELGMQLTLDPATLQKGTLLTFYFGPNQYDCLQNIAPKFDENYYLGITPLRQINKYIILPATKYLEGYFNHYLLILLVLLIILTLLQLPLTYQTYLLEIKQKALEPMIAKIKEQYQDDPLQSQIKEGQLKTKAGISLAGTFLSALLQLPIFFTIMNFVKYNIGFRQESFLWMEDLSTYDSVIHFSFRLPFLGSHISVIALLASFVMLIPSWLKTRHKSSSPEEKMMQYAVPLVFFFALNSYSSAFNLYRMISQIITLVPKFFFRLTVKEEPIRQAVLARLAQKETVTTPPRAQKRFAKRQKKKPT